MYLMDKWENSTAIVSWTHTTHLQESIISNSGGKGSEDVGVSFH